MTAEKPDVILIAYYFPPGAEIGGVRPYRFYKYLRRNGRRCYVVTASEQPAGGLPDVSFVPDETARFWRGERGGRLSLKAHAERVIRRWMYPGGNGIAWAIAAARCGRAIIAASRERKFVVISSFPPVGVLLAGLLLTFRGRAPWIADFRDPLANADPRRFPLANPVIAWLQKIAFRRAAAVIANTGPMAAVWRGASPRTESRIHVIWNGFDPEDQPAAREIPARPYRLLAHAGALYGGRTPAPIMQSLERLRAAEPDVRGIRLLLAGPLEDSAALDRELCHRAARQGWLDLRGTVPKSEAQKLIEEADLLLLLQPQSAMQVPGKLFEYLSIGRPIVALVPPRSPVEDILVKAGVPYVCLYPQEDPETLDRKLLYALRLSSGPVRASKWYEAHFNAERQAAQLASLIDGAVEEFHP